MKMIWKFLHMEPLLSASFGLSVIVLFLWSECCCQTIDDERRLMDFLIGSSRYRPYIRPVLDKGTITLLNITVGLFSLRGFNLTNGKASLSGYMIITWIDELLTWDPTQYGGLTNITLPDGAFWKPRMYNFKSNSGITNNARYVTHVMHSGFVYYGTFGFYIATCNTAVQKLPFDVHFCTLDVVPIDYAHNEMRFYRSEMVNTHYVDDSEWDLEIVSTSISDVFVKELRITYAEFRFNLRRRPSDMLLDTILPSFLITMLNLVSFFVPADSGERITFSQTLFLSQIFVISDIVDDLPSDAKDVTIFSILSAICHTLNTLGVVWSVVVSNMCHISENTHKPRLLVSIIGLLRKKKNRKIRDSAVIISENTHSQSDDPNLKTREDLALPSSSKGKRQDEHRVGVNTQHKKERSLSPDKLLKGTPKPSPKSDLSWKQVAQILDKMAFIICLLIYFSSFLAYLIVVLN